MPFFLKKLKNNGKMIDCQIIVVLLHCSSIGTPICTALTY